MVLYELCTLQRAFPGTNLMAVMYSIVEGERPELPAKFTFDLRNIYDRMLEKNPRKRPSAAVILQDSFLRRRLEVNRAVWEEMNTSVCVCVCVCVCVVEAA